MSKYIDTLTIGEIGDKNIDIRESVSTLSYDLSANMVSQVSFTVHDPGFKMHNNNYFMVGRRVVFNNLEFEIAAVGVLHTTRDSVNVTARSLAMQKLRRERGQKSFGRMAPTEFAALMAEKVGLDFFGESTPVSGNIIREKTENKDESSYDVCTRLAREAEFLFFEANGTLFFASEKFLIDNQPNFTINVPSESTDSFFGLNVSLRRSTDGKSAATFQANLFKNASSTTIFPGTGVKFKGVNNFEMTFLVDKVAFDASNSGNVAISGTAPDEAGDMACQLQVFQRGAEGECVKRIQEAVGANFSYVSSRTIVIDAVNPAEAMAMGIDPNLLQATKKVQTVNYGGWF